MSELSKKDIEKIAEAIAPKLVEQVQKQHHDFWIDPEQHYNDHYEWNKARKLWTKAGWIFVSAFLGLVIVGAFVLLVVGVISSTDLKLLLKMAASKGPG